MKLLITRFLLLLTLPNLVFAQSLDEQFSEPTGRTDQQMKDAQDFVHQGKKDKAVEEGCKQAGGACDGPEDGFQLEQLLSTAYSMLGLMPGFAKLTAKEPKTDSSAPKAEGATEGKKEKETKDDYCTYVAMAGEAIGKVLQISNQKKGEGDIANETDPQVASLKNVKVAHEARKKTAAYQRTLYSGVTACYGVMLWKGGAAFDWKLGAKMAASATIAVLYQAKVKKHKDAANAVQNVINGMVSADKCDPWTRTSCFCSEPTSKELYPAQYEEVCVLNNGNPEGTVVSTGCVAQNGTALEADPDCQCKLKNNCARNPLKGLVTSINGGQNLINFAESNLDKAMSGNFDIASIEKANVKSMALSNKLFPKNSAVSKTKLSSSEEAIAKELGKHLPEDMAKLVSKNFDPSNASQFQDNLPSTQSGILASLQNDEKKTEALKPLEYEKKGGKLSKLSDEPEFVLPQFPGLGGEAKTENGTEVISFAEQAVSKADVSNAPETPIFDIISNRYRHSWEKFEPETDKK